MVCRVGFNTEIRKVQSEELALGQRFNALRAAVERFCPNGFQTTFGNLESAVAVADPNAWTAQELTRGVKLLCQSRSHYAHHRAQWDDGRRQNKTEGKQTPTDAELGAFEAATWFDSISAGPGRRRHWAKLPEWVLRHDLTPGPFGSAPPGDVKSMLDELPPAELAPVGSMLAHHAPFSVDAPNPIAVPYRIYNAPMTAAACAALSETERLLADCWYSRSVDGFVRQHHLQRIVSAEQHWVVPYVIAALGDYVVEIAHEVAAGLSAMDDPSSWQYTAYRDFAAQNSAFLELTRQRAASYWGLHYSSTYAGTEAAVTSRPVYPAFQVLDKLGKSYSRSFRVEGTRLGPPAQTGQLSNHTG